VVMDSVGGARSCRVSCRHSRLEADGGEGGYGLHSALDRGEAIRGGAATGLICTTVATLFWQVSLISEATLKSGHTSPQKERGAVKNSVNRSM